LWKNRLSGGITAVRDVDQEPEESKRSSSAPLCNARLNPLLNPLLAKQLGRWAHIYYTAPVEKRAAAVEQLVLQLEAESAKIEGTGNPAVVGSASAEPVEPDALPSSVLLRKETLDSPAEVHPLIELEPIMEPAPPTGPAYLNTADVGQSSPGSDIESTLFAPETERPVEPDYPSFRELSAVSAAAIDHSGIPHPAFSSAYSSMRRLLVAASLVLVVGAAVWIATRRTANHIAHTPTSAQATVPAGNSHAPRSSAMLPHTPPAAAPESQSPEASKPVIQAESAKKSPPSGRPILPTPILTTPILAAKITSVETNPAGESPDAELSAGLRYLQGDGVERDSEEAARHLWKAVGKKNESALVLLAGLYAKGDGVAKDCDQARILILAASRQATTPAKVKSLENARTELQRSGCE
jgi:hypothetical protein